jgi:hypothetical protein
MLKMFWRMTMLAVLAAGSSSRADEVVMQNGDKLTGTIQSVTPSIVVLQNENLGNITLPRSKVSTVVLGSGAAKPPAPMPAQLPATVPTPAPAPAQINSAADLSSDLRGIRDQTNLVQQVQSQFLASASPDALAKFNEMLDGLGNGKIDMNDLRTQAKAAADQLRTLKKDAGSESGVEVDTYIAILDQFLQETAPTNATANPMTVSSATNTPIAIIAPTATNAPAVTNPTTTSK